MIAASMGVPKKRYILSVEITAGAQEALNRAGSETKMSNKDIIAQMLDWYSAQTPEVQSVVMGRTPASLVAAAQEIALRNLKEAPQNRRGGRGIEIENGRGRVIP